MHAGDTGSLRGLAARPSSPYGPDRGTGALLVSDGGDATVVIRGRVPAVPVPSGARPAPCGPAPARPAGGGHRHDIQGLRAVAVGLVVLYHLRPAGCRAASSASTSSS